jgi:hypothetical protein
LLVGLALQRGIAALGFFYAGMGPGAVSFCAIQTVLALVTAGALWQGRSWSVTALLLLGASLATSALLESFGLGIRPPITAVGEILVVALSTGALAWALRREFSVSGRDGGAVDREKYLL